MKSKMSVGNTVRYSDGVVWIYGVVDSLMEDDCVMLVLRDGMKVQMDLNQLHKTPVARDDKSWPEEEDCTHCPGRQGKEGPHKFGCAIGGSQRIKFNVNKI